MLAEDLDRCWLVARRTLASCRLRAALESQREGCERTAAGAGNGLPLPRFQSKPGSLPPALLMPCSCCCFPEPCSMLFYLRLFLLIVDPGTQDLHFLDVPSPISGLRILGCSWSCVVVSALAAAACYTFHRDPEVAFLATLSPSLKFTMDRA